MIRQSPWEVVTPDRIPTTAVRALKILTPKGVIPKIRWVRAMIRQIPWEVVTPDRIPTLAVRARKILTLKVGTPRIPWVAAILDKTPTARVGLLPQEMAVVEPVQVL